MSEINRFKLEWACRRGMRELDKMIMPFYQQHFEQLSTAQQQTFAELLNYSDPELFRWFMLQTTPPTAELVEMVALIRSRIEI